MNEITHASLLDSVVAGMAFLDSRCPGWFRKIDTDLLDVGSIDHCILGQIFTEQWLSGGRCHFSSPYGMGMSRLDVGVKESFECGFGLRYDDHNWMTVLNNTWAALIENRLEEATGA